MRRCFLLWFLFFAFVQAQGQAVLSSIDTLMQTRPDSALTCLMACYDTVDDRHYANLLLAELLYKNDYEQTNRAELKAAVVYYDSVSDPFLAARAHYINGVGYYERDSVVPACEQYLKAVEIMEEHFTEKELVGQKAKFMALTHTHLCELFSDQYLHEQAFYFGKQALPYYYRYNAEPWHIAWVLDEIGSHYDIMQQWDSARYYYDKAMDFISDTNKVLYRDIVTLQAFLLYKTVEDAESSLKRLKKLCMLSESPRELFSRCAIIGEIYFHEKMYDSAWKYLDSVFYGSPTVASQKQAAVFLAEICELQGRETDKNAYASFLIPFAIQEEEGSTLKSQLMAFYDSFQQKQLEREHQKIARKNTNLILAFGCCFIAAIIIVFIFYKKRIDALKKQEIKAKELTLSYISQYTDLLAKQGKIMQKLAIVMENKEDKALLDNLRATVFDKKDPWDALVEVFDTLHPDERERIRQQYPELTEMEFKDIILSYFGVSRQDEALMLKISVHTIDKIRTSVKKKTQESAEKS